MTTMSDETWRKYASGLIDSITESGSLQSSKWRAALEQVPRHVFVPSFYDQQTDGNWIETNSDSPSWLEKVYENKPLITALAPLPSGNLVTVSSSTKPGLMIRMLESLDICDDSRVLEIGTGTGYNAGLLAHRLGDQNVYSVDIDNDLVETARIRLAGLGYLPTLVATHGGHGLPEHAPYDRIIATCSVPLIPWAWADQVKPGGLVLVDLKPSIHAGSLALLRRYPDRLEGRFLKWAGFMAIRDTDGAPSVATQAQTDNEGPAAATRLDPLPWSHLVPWFLSHSRLPHMTLFGYRDFGSDGPRTVTFAAADGSWCQVALKADDDGWYAVRQGGPVRMWDEYERTYDEWDALGRPGWERLGLTVTPDQVHRVWLDDADSEHCWSI